MKLTQLTEDVMADLHRDRWGRINKTQAGCKKSVKSGLNRSWHDDSHWTWQWTTLTRLTSAIYVKVSLVGPQYI
jgi:hypothetical protein